MKLFSLIRRHITPFAVLCCFVFGSQMALPQLGFAQCPSPDGPLCLGNNFLVTGDYVVAGAKGLNLNFNNDGTSTGTIQFPDGNPGITGRTSVPPGAEILAAVLYYQTVVKVGQLGTGQNGSFRPVFQVTPPTGQPTPYAITGVPVNSHSAVSYSFGGCSGTSTGKIVQTYRADVRGLLPQDASGNVLVNSTDVKFEVRLPSVGPSTPLTLGAALVIIFRVLSKDFPLTAISMYEGGFANNNTTLNMTQTVHGLYQAATNPVSRLTHIVGGGKNYKFQTVYLNDKPLLSPYGSGQPAFIGYYNGATAYGFDTTTWTFPDPNNPGAGVATGADSAKTMVVPASSQGGCVSWGAVIVSTTFQNSDGDGLADKWKTDQGYCDVAINSGQCGGKSDTSWVSLADQNDPLADPNGPNHHQDIFIHYDHVVDQNGTSYALNPQAVQMVKDAFLAHKIHLHITKGGAIPDETCQDNLPRLCAFPNQPGVVGWFAGLAFLKNQPLNYPDELSCETLTGLPGNGSPCIRNFAHGENISYHYVLSANALGAPSWSLQDGSLTSVVATPDGKVTFTTSTPHGLIVDHNLGNGRVTIVYAITNPNLNGTYWVQTTPDDKTFTIQIIPSPVSRVTNYYQTTDWNLSVAPGLAGTSSGRSEVGGQNTVITLGSWGADGQSVLVQAGTLMHEFGHSDGLAHGGYKFPQAPASYVPTVGANCKPNYQSVMNYMFQVDLLDNGSLTNVVDYSGKTLDIIDKINTSHNLVIPPVSPFTIPPTYLSTSWYVPFFGVGTPAVFHCPGTLITDGAQMVRVTLPTSFLFWAAGQDINFDGNTSTEPPFEGVDDWDNLLDLRQLCATGCISTAGIGTGSGLSAAGGGSGLGAAGGGSGVGWAGAGSGVSAAGGGSGVSAAGGGSGLGYGGGGSGLTLAGGGSGVGIGGAGSGLSAAGGGSGKGHEITRAQANSVTRPPRNLMASEDTSARVIHLSWTAPSFGQIGAYRIYKSSDGGNTFSLFATVPGTQLTKDDIVACNPTGFKYRVTAVLAGTFVGRPLPGPPPDGQESVPSNTVPGPGQDPLTGCYISTPNTPATIALPGLSSPSSAVHGSLVRITWTLFDDFYPTNGPVNRTAANKSLVAIGPGLVSNNCVGPTTILSNGSPTPPSTFGVSAGLATFTWDTDGFCAGSYTFQLTLDSGQTQTTTSALKLQIDVTDTDSTPHVATTSLPDGVVGTFYSNTLSQDGGILPIASWTVFSGSLPPGISLDSASGTLSGTPTASGIYFFTVKVTDSVGNFGMQRLTLGVDATLPDGVVGSRYSNPLFEAGGVGPFTWTVVSYSLTAAGNASAGNTTYTGTFSPTVPANSTVNITGFTNTGNNGLFTVVQNSTSTQLVVNNPNGVSETHAGTATIQLPPGVSLDSASGTLSGTPTTAGTYTFTVKVTDSLGSFGTQTLMLRVVAGLWLGNDTVGDVFQTTTTGTVITDLPSLSTTGIAWDGTNLYFADPSGNFTKRTADGKTVLDNFVIGPFGGEDLAWDSKRKVLWRILHTPNTLQEIDPVGKTLITSYVIPNSDPGFLGTLGGLGIAYDSTRDELDVSFCSVGCSSLAAGLVDRVDPNTGNVLGQLFRTSGFATGGLAYDQTNDTLWVGDATLVRNMDRSGNVLSSFSRPTNGNTGFVDGLEFVSQVPAAPLPATNLSAQGGSPAPAAASVVLTWTASGSPIANVAGYNVYRATNAAGPFTNVTAAPTTSPFTDNTVSHGPTYYYVVTAVGANSLESANSNQVTAVVP